MKPRKHYGAPKRTKAQIASAAFIHATLTNTAPVTEEGFAAKVAALARGDKA